jgi:hypothetical protein
VRELLMTIRVGTAVRGIAPILLSIAVAGCVGDDDATMDDTDAGTASAPISPAPSVTITAPAEGDTVPAASLTVRLDVGGGLGIVMAGDTTPNTGHHHLFLDRDVTSPEIPIPAEPGFIVHMGDASATYTFENVAPGEHRLIAVVGDALHFPLQPWVVDTVRFVVR